MIAVHLLSSSFLSLPHGAVSWSAVCECGISRSYSLFLFFFLTKFTWKF